MQVGGSYDLIVVGDQLSGLFLAAGAAQRGMRVLVLEESNFPTVLYELPSGRFLGDFLAEPVVGLQESSLTGDFLRSLGLFQQLDELFPLHDPPLQLLSGSLRMDWHYGGPGFARSLRKEIGLPEDELEALRRLLSGEIVSRRSFSQEVAAAGLPVSFERIGLAQATLFGALLPEQLSYADYRKLCQLAALSVRFPSGGRGAVKEKLLGRLQAFGGQLRRASRVEELVFERGRLAGVLLSSYEGFVRSERVVGAMAARSFLRLLPAALRPKELVAAVAAVRPRAWKLGFTVHLPESLIPEGAGSHLASLDPELALEGEGLLQLQLLPRSAYGGVSPECRLLLGRVLMPYEATATQPRMIARRLRRAMEQVGELLPFLRGRKLTFFPDPERLETDPLFLRYYRFRDPSFIPDSLVLFERGLGGGGETSEYLDWSRFGLPGLALCSRDIRPLHGMLGEIASAMELLDSWKRRPGP